jgi:hypothetical protein
MASIRQERMTTAMLRAGQMVVPKSQREEKFSELEQYTCCPPPFFMIVISVVEVESAHLFSHLNSSRWPSTPTTWRQILTTPASASADPCPWTVGRSTIRIDVWNCGDISAICSFISGGHRGREYQILIGPCIQYLSHCIQRVDTIDTRHTTRVGAQILARVHCVHGRRFAG